VTQLAVGNLRRYGLGRDGDWLFDRCGGYWLLDRDGHRFDRQRYFDWLALFAYVHCISSSYFVISS
jgi:hypothetical protein